MFMEKGLAVWYFMFAANAIDKIAAAVAVAAAAAAVAAAADWLSVGVGCGACSTAPWTTRTASSTPLVLCLPLEDVAVQRCHRFLP